MMPKSLSTSIAIPMSIRLSGICSLGVKSMLGGGGQLAKVNYVVYIRMSVAD